MSEHLDFVSDTEAKRELVRNTFKGLQGCQVTRYQLAQIQSEGEWSDWEDLPIILELGDRQVAVCWLRFDELAIESDPERLRALLSDRHGFDDPESEGDMRWVSNGNAELDQVLGERIVSVALGAGAMSGPVASEKKVWNNLLLRLDSGRTLNIYNALDENAMELVEGETRLEFLS